jgi:hypothetical protein
MPKQAIPSGSKVKPAPTELLSPPTRPSHVLWRFSFVHCGETDFWTRNAIGDCLWLGPEWLVSSANPKSLSRHLLDILTRALLKSLYPSSSPNLKACRLAFSPLAEAGCDPGPDWNSRPCLSRLRLKCCTLLFSAVVPRCDVTRRSAAPPYAARQSSKDRNEIQHGDGDARRSQCLANQRPRDLVWLLLTPAPLQGGKG